MVDDYSWEIGKDFEAAGRYRMGENPYSYLGVRDYDDDEDDEEVEDDDYED